VLILALSFLAHHSNAQSISTADGRFELGLGFGPMFFVGDLGGSAGIGRTFVKDVDLPLTKISKGIYFNFFPTEIIGLRLAANLGHLEGADSEAPSKGGAEMDRKERNLHFKTTLKEAYAALEIYPTVLFEKYDGLEGKLRPYILGGVGIYHFDPQAKDVDGRWVRLQPLHLEGQGFPEYPNVKNYELTQMNLVMGGGAKFYLRENFYVGFEILHRKLFTDYVDDVSNDYYIDPIAFDANLPAADAARARRLFYRGIYSFPATRPYEEFAERGDPKDKDAYFSSIVRVGWRINSNRELKHLKCPVFY
jgi:hypothetical protein